MGKKTDDLEINIPRIRYDKKYEKYDNKMNNMDKMDTNNYKKESYDSTFSPSFIENNFSPNLSMETPVFSPKLSYSECSNIISSPKLSYSPLSPNPSIDISSCISPKKRRSSKSV